MKNKIDLTDILTPASIIEGMIDRELAAANKKFPAFATTHEGWAVLFEEVAETNKEIEDINDIAMVLFEDIMKSHAYDELKADRVSDIRHSAVKGIEELIQVAAMCDKFKALAGPEEIIPSMAEFYKNWTKRKEEEGDKFLEMLMNPSKGTGKPTTIKRWNAKIVPNDTEPCCEVTPSKYDTGSILSMGTLKPEKARETTDFYKKKYKMTDEQVYNFLDRLYTNRAIIVKQNEVPPEKWQELKSLAENANKTMEIITKHKCGNCKSYNWTPVSEHAICMNPKNQKTETKATWSCPEWEKGNTK